MFLDLDDIGAGERWKEALRKANARCEAVILLATPEALSSPECLAEVRNAEDCGKEIIVVLLRDVQLEDLRLGAFRDRQIVNLTSLPQSHLEKVDIAARPTRSTLTRMLAQHQDVPIQARHQSKQFRPGRLLTGRRPALSWFDALLGGRRGVFFGRDADILRGTRQDSHSSQRPAPEHPHHPGGVWRWEILISARGPLAAPGP